MLSATVAGTALPSTRKRRQLQINDYQDNSNLQKVKLTSMSKNATVLFPEDDTYNPRNSKSIFSENDHSKLLHKRIDLNKS